MNQTPGGVLLDMLLRIGDPKGLPMGDVLQPGSTNRSAQYPPSEPVARLLYVEDDTLLRLLMETTLRDAGFDAESVPSGNEAIAVLEAGPDRFRGVVTDIDLGTGPNGWEVARRARELIPSVPVVYVSGGGPGRWVSEGVPHSLMLTKPVAPLQVVVAISTLLNAAGPTPYTTG
jgi:CheY-like chemotaxis protein